MVEITELELDLILDERKDNVYIFYCYTPLCGTCSLARKMLEEWHESHPKAIIYSVNLNFNRALPLKWEVKSVPYVAIVINGIKVHEFYAFHSIDNIERQLGPFVRSDK